MHFAWMPKEILGQMVNRKRAIGVSGTHGKTTTSAMVAVVLEEAGLDPTNIIGDIRWATRRDYNEYLAWRTDSGYTVQLEEMLAQPMSIRYFDEVRAW